MRKYINMVLAVLFITFICTTAVSQDVKSESKKESSGKVVKKETKITNKEEQKKEIEADKKRKEKEIKKRKNKDAKLTDVDKNGDSYSDLNDDGAVNKGKPISNKKEELANKEEKDNKGNAYGKNKGELEGKDFGQYRAEQAKLKNKKKKGELGQSLTTATTKINDANIRIKKARANIERAKKDGKMTDKEYKVKMEKIERAEKAVKELEGKVIKSKRLIN